MISPCTTDNRFKTSSCQSSYLTSLSECFICGLLTIIPSRRVANYVQNMRRYSDRAFCQRSDQTFFFSLLIHGTRHIDVTIFNTWCKWNSISRCCYNVLQVCTRTPNWECMLPARILFYAWIYSSNKQIPWLTLSINLLQDESKPRLQKNPLLKLFLLPFKFKDKHSTKL